MSGIFIEDFYPCSDAELEKITSFNAKVRRAPLSSEPREIAHCRGRRGKRKARRAANDQMLGGVTEKDGDVAEEDEEEISYSPLSQLFLSAESMKIWLEFNDMTEEVQAEVLCSERTNNQDIAQLLEGGEEGYVMVDAEEIQQQDFRKLHPALGAEACIEQLSASSRAVLRHRAPLGVVLHLEACVRSSLAADPGAVHVQTNLSSYERLLLHAVSQYLTLQCHSFDDEDENRVTEVENPWYDFSPPDVMLADYVEMHWR